MTTKKSNAIVFVSGGLVQSVVTDDPDLRVIIVDYDNEGRDEEQLTDVPQPVRGFERAAVWVEGGCDIPYVERILKHIQSEL